MPKKVRETFPELWRSFIASIKSAYKLAPCLVILLLLVLGGVTWVAMSSVRLMVGTVLLLVLFVTIIVYATTSQFGEATLALVAGVLTAFSVDWTPPRFVAFIAVWGAFSTIALMISSVKLAGRSESLYRQASLALSATTEESVEIEKRLQTIGADNSIQGLGPIERAEVLLLLCYRKLPIQAIHPALKAVALISVVTQVEPKKIAVFIADTFRIFQSVAPAQEGKLVDLIYDVMKKSPVPPVDFVRAFENSRHLVLGKQIQPFEYLERLQRALERGVAPERCGEFMESEIHVGE